MVKQRPIFYYLFFILCAGGFYLLHFFGPALTEYLYNNAYFSFLNAMTGAKTQEPLLFYVGELELTLWGPLKSLLSTIPLLGILLIFKTNWRFWNFWFLIFAYLVATKFFIMTEPPYGESLTGLYYEAVWFLRNNMDYIGLHKAGIYSKGGPQFYPTSIYSFFIACMMKLIPNKPLYFFIMHSLTFVCGASVVALLREMLLKYTNSSTAALGALVFLFYPMTQCMTELINLEFVSVFFAFLGLYYLIREKFLLAFVFAVVSSLIKASGVVSCLTLFAGCILKLLTNWKRTDRVKIVVTAILTLTFAVALTKIRDQFMGGADQPINNVVGLFVGWHGVKRNPWFWIYLLCLTIISIRSVARWIQEKLTLKRVREIIEENFTVWIMFIMAASCLFMFLNYNVILYRYQLNMAPFIVFTIVYTLSRFIHRENFINGFLLFLLLACLITSHGLPYRHPFMHTVQIDCTDKPTPSCLERSLEYRNYLKLEKMIVKEIETNFSDNAIGAPWGIAVSLGLPEVGYTNKKLDIMLYEMTMHHLSLRKIPPFSELDPFKTIFISYKHAQKEKDFYGVEFPLHPDDLLVKTLGYGDIEARFFRGGIGIKRVRALIELNRRGLMDEFLRKEIPPDILQKIID